MKKRLQDYLDNNFADDSCKRDTKWFKREYNYNRKERRKRTRTFRWLNFRVKPWIGKTLKSKRKKLNLKKSRKSSGNPFPLLFLSQILLFSREKILLYGKVEEFQDFHKITTCERGRSISCSLGARNPGSPVSPFFFRKSHFHRERRIELVRLEILKSFQRLDGFLLN